jgi:hypothetical protein
MTFSNIKRLLGVFAVLMVVFGSGGAGSAAMCTAELVQCYYDAAGRDGGLEQAAAGLDCELAFAGCLREALFGI